MMHGVGLTRAIADYAVASGWDALPGAVRREAARAWLNWVGVAIGGACEPAVANAARYVAAAGAGGPATLIGHGVRAPVAEAAFVNCVASSVLAYDDAHLPSVSHPSGPAAAALFALAQARGVGGEDFLAALALAIELQCRVATMLVATPGAMNASLYVNGFSGPIGVAAGVGRLLGLDERRMGWAIGLAASQAAGFRATHGTMTAHFRPGHAARCGVVAALLAEQGFDCTDDALEARGGFIDVFAPGSAPETALDGLGTRHAMLENRYKPYPCGIVIHPVIDACLEIREQMTPQAAIARVRLSVNPVVLSLTGKRRPKTALESHVSVFHWAAVSLLGHAGGLAATEPGCLADPAVVALRETIEAEADPAIGKGEARAEVALTDDRVLYARVVQARGSEARPMTDDELDGKLRALTAGALPPAAVEPLLAACRGTAALADVGHEIGAMLP